LIELLKYFYMHLLRFRVIFLMLVFQIVGPLNLTLLYGLHIHTKWMKKIEELEIV